MHKHKKMGKKKKKRKNCHVCLFGRLDLMERRTDGREGLIEMNDVMPSIVCYAILNYILCEIVSFFFGRTFLAHFLRRNRRRRPDLLFLLLFLFT